MEPWDRLVAYDAMPTTTNDVDVDPDNVVP